ncbi:MAG: hypothetical protein QF437_04725 [Planctomycetota bacterium]|jgi:hypothetical protein|nr:hypothetical protein [Planctomycetota bacterium]MDP7129766.1 hypothetical protein [Planctomycetota bacterium]MDP7250148.1 hypothetical protein [Planctomycetota bacterium]
MNVIASALLLIAASLSAQSSFPLDRMDKDRNGELTENELGSKGSRILDRFDTNKDGKLGRDELEKARSMWMQKSTRGSRGLGQSSSRSKSSGGGRSSRFKDFPSTKPAPGDRAPAFKLKTLDGEPVSLASITSERPAVIEFGSFT